MNYRKIWESQYGPIPIDNNGVTFDIHHIDGNRKNNDINNLMCLSVYDHYKIHLKQFNETKSHKDRASLNFLKSRIEKIEKNDLKGHIVTEETRKKISDSLKGRKRPLHVGEAVRKKLSGYKWSDEDKEKRKKGLIDYHKNKSDEKTKIWKENLSKSHKGKVLSDETKLKLSKFNSKLTDDEVVTIYNMIKNSVPYKEISNKFNISMAQITSIKQRRTYYWINLE